MMIKPVRGRMVRDPVTLALMPEEGRNIDDRDPFWRRRLRDGDVQVVEPYRGSEQPRQPGQQPTQPGEPPPQQPPQPGQQPTQPTPHREPGEHEQDHESPQPGRPRQR